MTDNSEKELIRHFHKLFIIFILVILAVGLIDYIYAASLLKKQLVLKCGALAATVSAVIAEDSDGYAAFLRDMDTHMQYSRVMGVFIFQITASLLAGFVVMALVTHSLSGSAYLVVNRQLFAAHEAEQRLKIENAALDRINQMRSDIIATISHESRTPLAVLASYAGLVSMELKAKGVFDQDEQIAADLDAVAFEARRVANLIDGMRKLSQQKEVKAARGPRHRRNHTTDHAALRTDHPITQERAEDHRPVPTQYGLIKAGLGD